MLPQQKVFIIGHVGMIAYGVPSLILLSHALGVLHRYAHVCGPRGACSALCCDAQMPCHACRDLVVQARVHTMSQVHTSQPEEAPRLLPLSLLGQSYQSMQLDKARLIGDPSAFNDFPDASSLAPPNSSMLCFCHPRSFKAGGQARLQMCTHLESCAG
jgi:hypothetical protein